MESKPSMIQKIQQTVSDQDNNQKINASISVVLELYRVLVSSLLILFVPQYCKGEVCTLEQNMESESSLYTTGLVFNYITMFSFLVLYTIEVKRENRLITYLEVNKTQPMDNQSVGNALTRLSSEKRMSILTLDKYYQQSTYVSMGCFVINAILSGIIVYNYSLGNQTTTTFITNLLFMAMKLSDVYFIVNTEENIFYSAYLKGKVQFNDVDPDKIEKVDIQQVELTETK